MRGKVTPGEFPKMKEQGEKIVVLTAYDYPTAKILDEMGIEGILVGDSVGNTVLGYENTLPVTMEEMLHHAKAVARATKKPLLIGDMPFISYQTGVEDAIRNAGRFIKEADMEAVKVEGGSEFIKQTEGIISAGIPVMGHLGLTPQRIRQFGGYQPRGRGADEALKILEDAQILEDAGVFSIVLESIPKELGKLITERLEVPTIGIGAGPHCDGQVLVLHDILGLNEFSPKFVKKYIDLSSYIEEAVKGFREEVRSKEFPTPDYSYEMEEEELKKLKDLLEETS